MMKDDNQHSDESRAASGNSEQGNPLFPFPDRLFSVFSALGEKSKYLAFIRHKLNKANNTVVATADNFFRSPRSGRPFSAAPHF
jgi:hypothetical protein